MLCDTLVTLTESLHLIISLCHLEKLSLVTKSFSNDVNHLKFKHTSLMTCKHIFIDSLLKLMERAIAQPHFDCFVFTREGS